jgi:hypothetical protein
MNLFDIILTSLVTAQNSVLCNVLILKQEEKRSSGSV